MEIGTLVKLVNNKLAGEMLSRNELLPYLDQVVDYINSQLNSCFPTFTEVVGSGETDKYECFPDKYIRTVVVPGAAWNYYVVDEEGMNTAMQFQQEFGQNMFYMIRDYLEQVPEEYQCDSRQGSYRVNFMRRTGVPGIWVDNEEGMF